MKSEIKQRFTPVMLAELAGRYGVTLEQLETLDGFESFIYQFERDGGGYILRVGHSGRRGEPYVRGEVDWLNYLAAGGAGVAGAIHSRRGNLVETTPDGSGEYFIATAFHRALGVPAWEFGWSPDLFVTYGKALGRMHTLTTGYRLGDPLGYRPSWNHPAIMDVAANLAGADPLALEKFDACVEICRSLSQSVDSFGLVHFDAHAGNFLVNPAGGLTFFDFDDCNYNWFAYDIAIVLFYMLTGREEKTDFALDFMQHFLTGYRQEYALDPGWLETIPLFLKMREIDLYGVIVRDFDLDNLEDPWVARFMKGRKERIHQDWPYVDMDFSEMARWLSN